MNQTRDPCRLSDVLMFALMFYETSTILTTKWCKQTNLEVIFSHEIHQVRWQIRLAFYQSLFASKLSLIQYEFSNIPGSSQSARNATCNVGRPMQQTVKQIPTTPSRCGCRKRIPSVEEKPHIDGATFARHFSVDKRTIRRVSRWPSNTKKPRVVHTVQRGQSHHKVCGGKSNQPKRHVSNAL